MVVPVMRRMLKVGDKDEEVRQKIDLVKLRLGGGRGHAPLIRYLILAHNRDQPAAASIETREFYAFWTRLCSRLLNLDCSPSSDQHSRETTFEMPHSVSPDNAGTPDQVRDEMIVEPQAENGETQTTENTVVADTEEENGNTQGEDATDQDMTMEDVGVQGEKVPEIAVKEEVKSEVKLEDLFADVESDEEFPSSTALNVKTSSSPEAPSSPM